MRALLEECADFDVKGESIDEERYEESCQGSCEEEGCSEEEEVVSVQDRSQDQPGPRTLGAVFLAPRLPAPRRVFS
jgi:hypothetical protein